MSGLADRHTAAGELASVSADSHAIRQTRHVASERLGVSAGFEPTPAAIDQQTWTSAGRTRARQLLTLSLTNVARVAVDTARARLKCATVRVTSDGPALLTLDRPGHRASAVHLRRGTVSLQMCKRRRRPASRRR